jgi:hypothetical protein
MPSVLFVMDNRGLELMPMVKELCCSIMSQLANGSVAVKAMLIWKTLLACGTSNHDKKKKKKYPPHGNGGGRRQERAPLIQVNRSDSNVIDNRSVRGNLTLT